VTVSAAGGGRPAIDASSSREPVERRAVAAGEGALGFGQASRGYKEEMSHFAYCIRMRDEGMERDRQRVHPRCDGRAAMADAIMALSANQAMRHRQRIEFRDGWYDERLRERRIEHVPDVDQRVRDIDGNPIDT
jgi:hypothetical protein